MYRHHWLLKIKITAGISIGTLIMSFTTNAITGIIGNRADTVFMSVWYLLITSLARDPLPWILMLAAIGGVCFWWWRSNISSRALDTMNDIIGLDNSLLRLLPNIVSTKDRGDEVGRLLVELLRDITRVFGGDVHRASILLPDMEGEYLKIWAHYQMPAESIVRTVFYVGSDISKKRERGIAGEAFIKRETLVAHIMIENGQHRCDRNTFIEFDEHRPFPPYRSLVCVPIIGFVSNSFGVDPARCLGVVCLDSENSIAFDSSEVQTLLQMFSRRIATVLSIYGRILNLHGQLQTAAE